MPQRPTPDPSPAPSPSPGNPYLPPGEETALPGDQDAMLRPWKNRLHHDFFVTFEAAAENHQRFLGKFRDPGVVLNKGQLVTVTGPHGTGKTALIHRFAGLLADACPKYPWTDGADLPGGVTGGLTGRLDGPVLLISDLSESHALNAMGRDGDRSKEQDVYEALLDDLSQQRKLTRDESRRLRTAAITFDSRCRPDIPHGYLELAETLDDKNAVLVVLLPPIDHVGELSFYLRMARKRLVFMVESAVLADRDDLASEVKGMNHSTFTHLRTGPLTAADIRLFIETRQDRTAKDGRPWVTVTDEVIDKLCARFADQTVEQLRSALCELCHMAITKSGVVDIALYRRYPSRESVFAQARRAVRRNGGGNGP